MKKKILVLAMTIFTLVVMTLPLIPAAKAYGWEKSENTYAFSVTSGNIVADSEVAFRETRNWLFGKYTAHSEDYNNPGTEKFSIAWDDEELVGTEILWVSYKIDSDSLDEDPLPFDGGKLCQGIVDFKVEITFEGGKFKGHMQWVGDLVLKPDNTVRLPYNFPPMINEGGASAWYTYWQGTGAYAGWKITQQFGTAVTEPKNILLIP
jgi:hypothetical protein